MIHENRHTSAKRDMNLALDHLLPESAQAALDVYLAQSPGDAALWRSMQTVDAIFSNVPEAQAPPDFASKVMAAIAAAPEAAPAAAAVKPRAQTNPTFGIGLAIVIAGPLLVAIFLGVRNWLTDPAALNTLLQQIVLVLNTITQTVASIIQVITDYVNSNPIVPALLTTIIPLLMIWGWTMWYASQRRHQVVYHIPVNAA